MTRQELIAAMVQEYRAELEELNDAELKFQCDALAKLKGMSLDQWRKLYENNAGLADL